MMKCREVGITVHYCDAQLRWGEAWKGIGRLPPSLCTLPWCTVDSLPGHWATSHGRPIPSAGHTMLSFYTRASAEGMASSIDPNNDILNPQVSLL